MFASAEGPTDLLRDGSSKRGLVPRGKGVMGRDAVFRLVSTENAPNIRPCEP
jgi:hypothetical protein